MGKLKKQTFDLREGLRVVIRPGGWCFPYVDLIVEEEMNGNWNELAAGCIQFDQDDFLRFLDVMERVWKLMVLQ